jgi:peptidoglycan-associated lipoprotein
MKLLRIAAVLAAVALAGCADEAPPNPNAGMGAGTGSGTAGAGMPAPDTIEYFNQVVGDRVFFATDEYTLDSAAQGTLSGQAEWLLANPGTSVTIEGHADERGTRQYNLALGARRANSVREYLMAQGVEPARLKAITYGKERPVALCSDESCWSQNRRAVSVVVGMPVS